ncbi:MAG: hypothetical protein ABJ205_03725 [Erythrobacter sp.]|uniref:hypothetical protein n=1 Tax=Erythrobacter sp. TaxID=1042 RepID=UPI003266EA15
MIDLLMAHPIRALIAVVLGLATAWWIWGRLGEVVADTAGKATGAAKGAAGAAGNAASGAASMAGSAASGAAGMAKGAASAAGDATSGAVDAAKGAGSAVAGGVAAAGAGVAAAAGAATDKAKETIQDVANMPKIALAVGDPDDLTKIKGVGPKLAETCQSLGVSRFDQISKWTDADIAEVDQYLKFKGRITRDNWVGQAAYLAAGDTEGHKAKFG